MRLALLLVIVFFNYDFSVERLYQIVSQTFRITLHTPSIEPLINGIFHRGNHFSMSITSDVWNNIFRPLSIAAKRLRTLSSLFSLNLIHQSSCRIMTIHAKTRPILHADWSIRLGENGPDRALKHLAATLVR